jgi:uncharacterized membrane protein YebE (DUF533 family)
MGVKRLTVSGHTCVETLALLVAMAWADGHLEDSERASVRGAADVLNLSKAMRDRLDLVLDKPMPVNQLLIEAMSSADRAFAYVAAAWMSGVDDDVDEREEAMLDEVATLFEIDVARKVELEGIARGINVKASGERNASEELVALFRAIPPRLQTDTLEEADVVFD